MKAVLTKGYGSLENLSLGEITEPVLDDASVLVENHYFSINPVDFGVRGREYKVLSGKTAPKILGADFCGTVSRVGSKVTRFKAGDRVVGMLNPFKGGAYAEVVLCPEKQLTQAPTQVDDQRLAALPLVDLTAYQALVIKGDLKAGDTVVINGASGGVGHIAVQLAKHLGAKVIATCHPQHIGPTAIAFKHREIIIGV